MSENYINTCLSMQYMWVSSLYNLDFNGIMPACRQTGNHMSMKLYLLVFVFG